MDFYEAEYYSGVVQAQAEKNLHEEQAPIQAGINNKVLYLGALLVGVLIFAGSKR